MRKAVLFLTLWACCPALLADDTDAKIKAMKKVPPPITGGFSFKMYGIPENSDKETLIEQGALFLSPRLLSETQIPKADDQKYGMIERDEFVDVAHGFDTCLAMVQLALEPMHAPGNMVKLAWVGGHRSKGYLTVHSWPDAWDKWEITQSHGKIDIQDIGSEQGWGLKNVRIVAEADPSVNLESCLGYLKSHGR